MNKNILQSLKVTTLALILSFGLSFAYAWTAPTTTPPGGNTAAPLNVSGTTQLKSGALGVNGLFRGYSDLYVDGNMKVGTTTSALLDVAGIVKATGLQLPTGASAGKVLTSDASGNASWGTGGGRVANLVVMSSLANTGGSDVTIGWHGVCVSGGSSINTASAPPANYFYYGIHTVGGPDASGRMLWAYWSDSNNPVFPISVICFDIN